MTDKTEAQPEALRLEVHQECADFATSLRSAANTVHLEGKKVPPSFLRAADLFERASAELRRQHAEIQQLKAQLSARAVPGGWRLVPAEPTEEMVAAAEEAHMPFGDMQIAILLALSAAPPPPEREPLLPDFPVAKLNSPACWCETCDTTANSGLRSRMSLCPDCGNKRCPKATNHVNACTNSNAPGQPGSSWEHVKPHGISAAIRARGTGGGE